MKTPITYEMTNKHIVIIGAGIKTYSLATTLKKSGADLTIVSKSFAPMFERLEGVNKITDILKHIDLDTHYFDAADFVVIATNNSYLNKAIHDYAHEKRIPVLSRDPKLTSDFTLMEFSSKNGLTLAATSMAKNPGFEYEVVNQLLESVDEETFKRLKMLFEEKARMKRFKS